MPFVFLGTRDVIVDLGSGITILTWSNGDAQCENKNLCFSLKLLTQGYGLYFDAVIMAISEKLCGYNWNCNQDIIMQHFPNAHIGFNSKLLL